MPKLDLRNAARIKTAGGELAALKGAGFDWVRPEVGPTITIAAPTFSENFSAYANGFRLAPGDPNDDYGLGTGNPGNLGWDALTSIAATNARFNPIVFGGQLRERTTSAAGDFAAPGVYLLSPPGVTQEGAQYVRAVMSTDGPVARYATMAILGANQTERLEMRLTNDPTAAKDVAVRTVIGGTTTSLSGVGGGGASGSTGVRMGAATNGIWRKFDPVETMTMLSAGGKVYLRRGAGFPLGSPTGATFTAPSGNRFGVPSLRTYPAFIRSFAVGGAPLFITLNQTYRTWVPKKRANASDPITAGVGDATFTGTYVGTIPSKMQWALYDLETGAQVKDWALVSDADFTASAGTWSARLRSIPAGLNGRRAYAPGFRPVDAENKTDPAWQVVGFDPFFVTLNVGTIGQSNAARFGTLAVTGTEYPKVDGLTNYARGVDLAFGLQSQAPRYYDVNGLSGFCSYELGDYLADLYDLPISFEQLSVGGQAANSLGPGGVNWESIQVQHAAVGGAYDILYLSQGEQEFANNADLWLTRWADTNIPAYRDPAMHGQPAGTVIPIFYTLTGRFDGIEPAYSDEQAQTLRVGQYALEAAVPDCYLAHSYAGVAMIDTFHYDTANGKGYNDAARRTKLTYDKAFNAGPYDGRGPIAISASRSGAVITVSFDLNGADNLTTRNGTDQASAGTAGALTSWQVSDDDFATTLTITSAVQTGDTVVITLSADPGGPVKVRNHYGLNPDISSFPAGEYTDGTFICMMPLTNPLTAA